MFPGLFALDTAVDTKAPDAGSKRYKMAAVPPMRLRTLSTTRCATVSMPCACANRRSHERDDFVGQSWIVSPEGDILAETTAEAPIATVDIDVREATSAKQTYPRNLP
jgi:predicted amidohydrolase